MEYRAVGNRCAVDLNSLELPVGHEEALDILIKKGFRVIDVNVVALARGCIGVSRYNMRARPSEAPAIVNCSNLIKWIYGQRGIWLPRRSIQQRALGEIVPRDAIIAGDLVFASGWNAYYVSDAADGVGHVGIATGDDTIIFGKNKKVGVIEGSLDAFALDNTFRGVRRYIPAHREVLTFETPVDPRSRTSRIMDYFLRSFLRDRHAKFHYRVDREVEIADDMKWIVLQSLPEKVR